MIDRDHDLPLTRQAAVLNISRGSLYYKPRPVSAADLALMRRMDELHLEFPFAGARPRSRYGIDPVAGRGLGGIRPAIDRFDRPNQVWAMDITYVPMARAWLPRAARWAGVM